MKIRYVTEDDIEFWKVTDRHLSECELTKKIRDKQGYVLIDNSKRIGLLRFNLFWDSIPFCTMLYVDERYRGLGHGKALMQFWEEDMRSQGHGMTMVSTRSDEQAQNFYRRLGYSDSGALIINIPKYEQPSELFFTKAL